MVKLYFSVRVRGGRWTVVSSRQNGFAGPNDTT
jgi:hypothetical protein